MTKSKTDGHRPNPEVPERAKRRRFSAEYKLRILQEADRCKVGELGELLRREGLYSSHIVTWRRQRDEGALSALSKKRGRKAKRSPQEIEIERLRKDNERLREQRRQLELIVAAQKKVAALEQALEEADE
jgi:transposase